MGNHNQNDQFTQFNLIDNQIGIFDIIDTDVRDGGFFFFAHLKELQIIAEQINRRFIAGIETNGIDKAITDVDFTAGHFHAVMRFILKLQVIIGENFFGFA
ncbi:hypothetical protein SDC9_150851 [bioreactor metagenome]|uniref:Uncharacterized protein n=1 Tax=bioreactor metagenome TaxID=1076179 RepID=A0A645EQJ0_9ZZZZ